MDLKPCPLCDGEAFLETDRLGGWWVQCKPCGASCGNTAAKVEACQQWNTRASNARIEALEAALVKAALPLEAMVLSGSDARFHDELRQAIADAVITIRSTLLEKRD